MKKLGISLVALVITIVVLVILTGAVIITGINVPTQALLAVFKSNVGAVQDAVTMKMLNNMAEYSREGNVELYKWVGVVSGYTTSQAEGGTAPAFTITNKIPDVSVAQVDNSIGNNLSESDVSKYYVDANGIVYHEGKEFNGVTYYNTTKTFVEVRSIAVTTPPTKITYVEGEAFDPTGMVVTATYVDSTTQIITAGYTCTPNTALATTDTSITITYGGKTTTQAITVTLPPSWAIGNAKLNSTTPYVSETIEGTRWYAPIPKGFVASTVATEDGISEGLVIYDTAVDGGNNQFVWIPVNATYNISPQTSYDFIITEQTALAYWQAAQRNNGTLHNLSYSEPYTSAESWETAEYIKMMTSVMKYGGFYIGRYETGKSGSTPEVPVVKAGATVWNEIAWGSSKTTTGSGTATALARELYSENNANYGATSTLCYGIQWDSAMYWCNCATVTTNGSNTSLTTAGAEGSQVFKNVYDLADNVYEHTMESSSTYYRAARGGSYTRSSAPVCYRSGINSTVNSILIGFRLVLYVE